jgi:heat shock protein HtpX
MFDAIASNRRRSYLLLFVVVLLIVGVAYVFGLYYELGHWIVIPAVAFALMATWGGYYYSDKIVLRMSQARAVAKQEEPYLWNTVEGLSIAAGIPSTPRSR